MHNVPLSLTESDGNFQFCKMKKEMAGNSTEMAKNPENKKSILKGADTLSGEAILSILSLSPSEMGSTLKEKNLLPWEANSFLLE